MYKELKVEGLEGRSTFAAVCCAAAAALGLALQRH